ncbi:MAG: hypothetical protein D6795_12510, partial [Deltaproteobacteria bacterium]
GSAGEMPTRGVATFLFVSETARERLRVDAILFPEDREDETLRVEIDFRTGGDAEEREHFLTLFFRRSLHPGETFFFASGGIGVEYESWLDDFPIFETRRAEGEVTIDDFFLLDRDGERYVFLDAGFAFDLLAEGGSEAGPSFTDGVLRAAPEVPGDAPQTPVAAQEDESAQIFVSCYEDAAWSEPVDRADPSCEGDEPPSEGGCGGEEPEGDTGCGGDEAPPEGQGCEGDDGGGCSGDAHLTPSSPAAGGGLHRALHGIVGFSPILLLALSLRILRYLARRRSRAASRAPQPRSPSIR